MRVTIDDVGRVVVPKSVRDAMGLKGGSALEMNFEAGLLVFSVPTVAYISQDDSGRQVIDAPAGTPPLTDDDIRNVLESVRP